MLGHVSSSVQNSRSSECLMTAAGIYVARPRPPRLHSARLYFVCISWPFICICLRLWIMHERSVSAVCRLRDAARELPRVWFQPLRKGLSVFLCEKFNDITLIRSKRDWIETVHNVISSPNIIYLNLYLLSIEVSGSNLMLPVYRVNSFSRV